MTDITFAGERTKGQKFFIWLWTELFCDLTIDIYRVKLMNSKTILQELLEVISYVENGVWDISNIKHVSNEAMQLITNDKILKKTNYYASIVQIINELINKQTSEDKLTNVKILISAIINQLENNYFDQLISGLMKSIEEENFEDIEWYTNSLATEVSYRGYSSTYINHMNKKLYDGEAFTKSMENIRSLDGKKQEFTVYFSITSNIANMLPESVLEVSFMNKIDVEVDTKFASFKSEQTDKKFAKVCIKAVDINVASVIARSKLGTALDIVNFGLSKKTNFISIGNRCLVVCKNNFQLLTDSEIVLIGYSKNEDSKLTNVEKNISKIISSSHVSDTSKNKIKSGFRYYRLSKEANNMEHKFLNLWIALEQLVKSSGSHASLIGPVVDYIPKCMSIGYVNLIIRDFIENIYRCNIEIPMSIKEYFDKNNTYKFIELLRNEEFCTILRNKVKENNPLLDYRLEKLKSGLSKSIKVEKLIEKYNKQVDYQLTRMYRIRNRIVHGAAFDLTISGLTSRLLSFVKNTINAMLFQMYYNEELNETLKVFLKYKFTYVQYIETLKKDKKDEMNLEILINPMNLLWP